MIKELGECDRCKQPVRDGEFATLRSLEHVLRKAKPQSRVELCTACYAEFRRWVEGGKP